MYGNAYTTNLPTESNSSGGDLYYNDFTKGTYTVDSTQLSNVLNIFQDSGSFWESSESNPYGTILPLGEYNLDSSSSNVYKAFDGNPNTQWNSRLYQHIVDYGSNINVITSSNSQSLYKNTTWTSDSTYGHTTNEGLYWLYGSNNNSIWISNPTYGFNYSTYLTGSLSRNSPAIYGGVSSNLQSATASKGSFDGNTWSFYSNLYGGKIQTTTFSAPTFPVYINGSNVIQKIQNYIFKDSVHYITVPSNTLIKDFIFYPTSRNTQGVYYTTSDGTDGYTNVFYDVVRNPKVFYTFYGVFIPQEDGIHSFQFIKNNEALLNGDFNGEDVKVQDIITLNMAKGVSNILQFTVQSCTNLTLLTTLPSGTQLTDATGFFGTPYNADFPSSMTIVGEFYTKLATFTQKTSYPNVNVKIYPSNNGTNRIQFATQITDSHLNINSNIFTIIQQDVNNIYGYFVDETNQIRNTPYPEEITINSFTSGSYGGEFKSYEYPGFSGQFNNVLDSEPVLCSFVPSNIPFKRYRIETVSQSKLQFESISYILNLGIDDTPVSVTFSDAVPIREFQVESDAPLNFIRFNDVTFTNISNTNIFRKILQEEYITSTATLFVSNTSYSNITNIQFYDSNKRLLNTNQDYIGDGIIGQYVVSNIFPCTIGIYGTDGNSIQRFRTINTDIGNIYGDWFQIKFPSTVNLNFCLFSSDNASNVIVLTSTNGVLWNVFAQSTIELYGGTQKITGIPVDTLYVRVAVRSVHSGISCKLNYIHFYDSSESRIDQDILTPGTSIISFPTNIGGYYKGNDKIGESITFTSDQSFKATYIGFEGVIPEIVSIYSENTFIDTVTSYSPGYYKINNNDNISSNTYTIYVVKTSNVVSSNIKLYDQSFVQQMAYDKQVTVSAPGRYVVSNVYCFDSNSSTRFTSTYIEPHVEISIKFQYPVEVLKFSLVNPFFKTIQFVNLDTIYTIESYDDIFTSEEFPTPVISDTFTFRITSPIDGSSNIISLKECILYSRQGRINEPVKSEVEYVSNTTVYGGHLSPYEAATLDTYPGDPADSFNIEIKEPVDIYSITFYGNVIPSSFVYYDSNVSFDTIKQQETILAYTQSGQIEFEFNEPSQIKRVYFNLDASINWNFTISYDGLNWFKILEGTGSGGTITLETDHIVAIRFNSEDVYSIVDNFVFYGFQNIVQVSPEYTSSINPFDPNSYDSDGNYIGQTNTNGIYGEWFELYMSEYEFPLTQYSIQNQDSIQSWTILGSNDGVTWTILDTQTVYSSSVFTIDNTTTYSRYRFVLQRTTGATITPITLTNENGFMTITSSLQQESYNTITGVYEGTSDTQGYKGKWFQYFFRNAVNIYAYSLNNEPNKYVLLGSRDGSDWKLLDSQESNKAYNLVGNNDSYTYIRIVILETNINSVNSPIESLYINEKCYEPINTGYGPTFFSKYYTLDNPESNIWEVYATSTEWGEPRLVDSRTEFTHSNVYYVSNNFPSDVIFTFTNITGNNIFYGYYLYPLVYLNKYSSEYKQVHFKPFFSLAKFFSIKVIEIPPGKTNSYSIDSVELHTDAGIKIFPYESTFLYGTTEAFGQYDVSCSTGANVYSLFTKQESRVFIQETQNVNFFKYPDVGFVRADGTYGNKNGPGQAHIQLPYNSEWVFTSESPIFINGENSGSIYIAESFRQEFILEATSPVIITNESINFRQDGFSSSVTKVDEQYIFGEYVEISLPCIVSIIDFSMSNTGTEIECVGSTDGLTWSYLPAYCSFVRIIATSDPVVFGNISLFTYAGKLNSYLDSGNYITSPTFYAGLSDKEFIIYNFPQQLVNAYSVNGTVSSWVIHYKETSESEWTFVDEKIDFENGYYNIPETLMSEIRFRPTKKPYSDNPSVVIDSFEIYDNRGYKIFPRNVGTVVNYFPSVSSGYREIEKSSSGGSGDFTQFTSSSIFNPSSGEYLANESLYFFDDYTVYGEWVIHKMKTGNFTATKYTLDSNAREWTFFGVDQNNSFHIIDSKYQLTTNSAIYSKTIPLNIQSPYVGYGIIVTNIFPGNSQYSIKLDVYNEEGETFYNLGGPGSEYIIFTFDIPQPVHSILVKFKDSEGSTTIENSNDGETWTPFDNANSFRYYKITVDFVYKLSFAQIEKIQFYTKQGYEIIPTTVKGPYNFTPLPVIETSSSNSFTCPTSVEIQKTILKTEYFSTSNVSINIRNAQFNTSLYTTSYINRSITDQDKYGISTFSPSELSNGKYGKSLPIDINIISDGLYDLTNSVYSGNYDEFGNIQFGGGYDENGIWVLQDYTLFPGSLTNDSLPGQYYEYINPRFNFNVTSITLTSSNIIEYVVLYTQNYGITWSDNPVDVNGFRVIVWRCTGNITGTLEIQTDTNGYPGYYTENGNIDPSPYGNSYYDSIGQWSYEYDEFGNESFGGGYDKFGNPFVYPSDWTIIYYEGNLTYITPGQILKEYTLGLTANITSISVTTETIESYVIHGSIDLGETWFILYHQDTNGEYKLSNIYQSPPVPEEVHVTSVSINAFRIQIIKTNGDPSGSFVFQTDKNAYIGNYDIQGNVSYATGYDALGIYIGGYDIDGIQVLGGGYDVTGNPYTFPGDLGGVRNPNEYPPTAMIADTTTISAENYGNGTYTASSSGFTSPEDPYKAFDENSITQWTSINSYNIDTGEYIGTSVETNGVYGEWIQIQLPEEITLFSYSIESTSPRTPSNWSLFGSVNGETWTLLDFHTGIIFNIPSEVKTFNTNFLTTKYSYFRIVIEYLQPTNDGYCSINEIKFNGLQGEYPRGLPGYVSILSFPQPIEFSLVEKINPEPLYYFYNNGYEIVATNDITNKFIYSDPIIVAPERCESINLVVKPIGQQAPPGNYDSNGLYLLNGQYDILGQYIGSVLESIRTDLYFTVLKFEPSYYMIDATNLLHWSILGTKDNGVSWNLIDNRQEGTGDINGNGPYYFKFPDFVNGIMLDIHKIDQDVGDFSSSLIYYDSTGNDISLTQKAYNEIENVASFDITCNPCVITGYGFLTSDQSLQWNLYGGQDNQLIDSNSYPNTQVQITGNTLAFDRYRFEFAGSNLIKIDDIFIQGPEGNYNKTVPYTQMTNTVAVKYPPIQPVVLPVTIQGFSYGNGLYFEGYNNVSSSTFGTYTIDGENASVTMFFPYSIKITEYSIVSQNPYILTATNNDIIIDTLASEESSDGERIHIKNTNRYSRYTFTFPNSIGETVTGLSYYGEFTYTPENPSVWFSENRLNVSGTIPTSDFTIVYIIDKIVYTIVHTEFSLVNFEIAKTENILNLQNSIEYIVYNYKKTYNDVIRDVKYLLMKYL